MTSSLSLSRSLYEQYVTELSDTWTDMPAQQVTEAIERIVNFAWQSHVGLLRDPRLERILSDMAVKKGKPKAYAPFEKAQGLNILFVATLVHFVGGHSKMMWNWIDADKDNIYHLALTNQKKGKPEFLDYMGDRLTVLDPTDSHATKAEALNTLVQEGDYDLIMLFQHPSDVVPSLALESCKVPVINYNHADHVFWLGGSVSDSLIDYRVTSQYNSKHYRNMDAAMLPFIVDPQDKCLVSSDKQALKAELGIKAEKVLVSMASHYKYAPVGEVDFFETLIEYLKLKPELEAYMIGPTVDDVSIEFKKGKLPKNLICLGNLEDPAPYLQAGDIFLEPFPMSTGLGLCEAIKAGLVPHFSYHTNLTIYAEGVRSIFNMHDRARPAGKEAYYKELDELLERGALFEKRREEFSAFIDRCSVPKWNASLHEIYLQAAQSKAKNGVPNQIADRKLEDDERCASWRSPEQLDVLDKFISWTYKPLSQTMAATVKKHWRQLAWKHKSLHGRKELKTYLNRLS